MRTGKIITGYGMIQRDVMIMPISIYAKAVYCLLVSYTGNKDVCYPSLKTIALNLSIAKSTVINALAELEAKELILKSKQQLSSGLFENNLYEPLYLLGDGGVVRQEDHGSPSGRQGVVREAVTNNNIKRIYESYDFFNEKFEVVWKSFLEMRKKKRQPATERAETLLLNTLVDLSGNNHSIAIQIVEKSIMNSWTGLFQLPQVVKANNRQFAIVDESENENFFR